MTYLSVKNFGPIQDAALELKPLTLLVGQQASGKSTLAKLAYFFYKVPSFLLDLASEDDFSKGAISRCIRDNFVKYFGNQKGYEVSFTYAEDKIINLPENPTFESNSWFLEVFNSLERGHLRITRMRKNNDLQGEEREKITLFQNLNRLFHTHPKVHYLPAGRNISVSYSDVFLSFFRERFKARSVNGKSQADILILQDFISYVEDLKEEFKHEGLVGLLRKDYEVQNVVFDRLEEILKARYRYSEDGEYLHIKEEKVNVSLSEASSGQQESIRLLQDIAHALIYKEEAFRIVEEPENHLSPQAQKALIELYAILTNTNREGITLLTTHSPYVLGLLNNLLYAGQFNDEQLKEVRFLMEARLVPEQVGIYTLNPNETPNLQSVIDPQEGLLGHSLIDEGWENLQDDFDTLYSID